MEIDDSLPNGGGHGSAGKGPGQIKKSGHGDRLARGEHFGRDDSGDRIGGVVKAVDVFEGDRRQDDEDEKNHTNPRPKDFRNILARSGE